ncbi:hypothetical protein ACQPYK_01570 [Streptosporangium sp. CA-135522]|uniref:hypothetical protein n=1 Tax=Streptosporangium sp. CA-135522 TaxID=3240072 RepID=UPI003D92F630
MRHALKDPERSWSSPATLTVCAAAAELHGWLGDSRAYDPGNHKIALRSAIDDFTRSTKSALPAKVQDAIRAELRALQPELRSLHSDPAMSRTSALSALNVLIERLKSSDVLQAAWFDLWAKCRRLDSSAEAIAIRRDLFFELVRLAEHDLEHLLHDVDGLLSNDARTVQRVRVDLGDVVTSDALDEAPQVWETTDLSADERRDLVSRYLSLPVASRQHVLWLAYERAALHSCTAVTVGNMAFFDSQIIPSEPQAIIAKLSQYGEQWTESDGLMAAEMPRGQGIVLVRVFLPADTYANPVRAARDQVEALVTLGKFHADADQSRVWHLLAGAQHQSPTHVRFQRITPSSGFPDRQRSRDQQARVFKEMTAWATNHSKIPITEVQLAEAIELLGWWRDALSQPALGRVTANVRVIEVAASRASTPKVVPWAEHLTMYMKPAWLVYQTRSELASTIYDAVGADMSQLPTTMWKQLQDIADKTVHYDGLDRVELVPNSTRQAVTELLALFPHHHQTSRRLSSLHQRLDDPAAFHKWHRELEAQWERLIDRLVRVRNAVTHGGPAANSAIESVAHFSGCLAAWEIETLLEAALTGDGLPAAHQKFLAKQSNLLDTWMKAQHPGDHLYL